MTSFRTILGTFLALALVLPAGAAAQEAGIWLLPEFDTAPGPLVAPATGDEVRVLVFPHLTANPPQGRDSRVDRVLLRTEGECTASIAELNPPRKRGPEVETFSAHEFSASMLSQPRWIECDAPVRIVREAGVPSYSYEGALLVRRRSRGIVEVINILPLEEYLRGVVPIEMPTSWPLEALKAQSVAARTYAWFHVSHSRRSFPTRPYDMDDTVQYQAYTGTHHRAASTDRAIRETAGQMMLHDGQLIQAFFSADAGGHTEDAVNVWPQWGGVPYCIGKPEAFQDSDLDWGRWGEWKARFSWASLTTKLRSQRLIPPSGRVQAVRVLPQDRFASGRARVVRFGMSGGGEELVDAQAVRRALGLRSTLIKNVSVVGRGLDVELSGRGYGHGVGMSQVGAMTMASRYRWDYRRILEFYYTAISIR